MSRILGKTVLAGGVVYPAGTPEDAIANSDAIRPEQWVGYNPETHAKILEVDQSDHPNTQLLREAVEYILDMHLEDRDVPVGHLLLDACTAYGEPGDQAPPADPPAVYSEAVDQANAQVDTFTDELAQANATLAAIDTPAVTEPTLEPKSAPMAQPAANASREQWADFALATGVSADELVGKSRNEIRDQYGNREQG